MFPVNLRRLSRPRCFRGNYASFVVEAPGGQSQACLHRRLGERLARGEHWLHAANLDCAATLGPRPLGWGFRLVAASPFRFLGLFSNLGRWHVPELEGDDWCVAAPPTLLTPLALAAVTVNGRLSMTGRSRHLPHSVVRDLLERCHAISLDS
jgi:hypothetical protein